MFFFVWVERLSNKGGSRFLCPLGVPSASQVEVLTAALDRHKDRPDAVIAVPGMTEGRVPDNRNGIFGGLRFLGSRDWIPKFVEVWPWGGVKFPVILKAVKAPENNLGNTNIPSIHFSGANLPFVSGAGYIFSGLGVGMYPLSFGMPGCNWNPK